MATLSSAETPRSDWRHTSSSGGSTPAKSDGDARPFHSSGSPNAALSRASPSVSSTTSASSDPAHANPCRWSLTTRTPTPSTPATDSDSTSPSKTRTSVSRDRTTYASTCSPLRAAPATRCARSSNSPEGPSLTGGAADGQLRDSQRRLPRGDGHALPELPASAGPRPEVVAERVDVAERLGAVADEVGGAYRLGDLAVLDEVRLGHPEHEVARRRVHLPTPELRAVDAVRRLTHDLVGIVLPREEVRVGHANHREVLVRLPPSVSALLPAFLPGADQVPHVVGQDTALDEHVVARRRALVVDRVCAPLARQRPIVDQRDERRRDLLAGAAAEHRRVLGHEVGFEAVAACLVEQDAAGALLQHHRQLARRRRPRSQHRERPAGGRTRHFLRVDVVEELETDSEAWRLHPRL